MSGSPPNFLWGHYGNMPLPQHPISPSWIIMKKGLFPAAAGNRTWSTQLQRAVSVKVTHPSRASHISSVTGRTVWKPDSLCPTLDESEWPFPQEAGQDCFRTCITAGLFSLPTPASSISRSCVHPTSWTLSESTSWETANLWQTCPRFLLWNCIYLHVTVCHSSFSQYKLLEKTNYTDGDGDGCRHFNG